MASRRLAQLGRPAQVQTLFVLVVLVTSVAGDSHEAAHSGHDEATHAMPPVCDGHVDDGHWGYYMPQCWRVGYHMCGGRQQSPIDIHPPAIGGEMKLGDIVHWNNTVEDSRVMHTGHTFQVDVPGEEYFGNVTLNGSAYVVRYFNLHFPSEHAINGRLYDGEVHVVHQLSTAFGTDGLLIVATFFDKAYAPAGMTAPMRNIFLERFGIPFGAPEAHHEKKLLGGSHSINLHTYFHEQLHGDFYRYDGSQTAPPCSESVKWFVSGVSMPIDQEQIDMVSMTFNPSNNRPLQLLNGRAIIKNGILGCTREMGDLVPGESFSYGYNYLYPQCWGMRFPMCDGLEQSPINIDTTTTYVRTLDPAGGNPSLYSMMSSQNQDELTMVNDGHRVMVECNGCSHMLLPWNGGTMYKQIRFSIHFPSEHSVDGHLAETELHIVHELDSHGHYADNEHKLLMIAIMFDLSTDEEFDNLFLTRVGFGRQTIPGSVPYPNEPPLAVPLTIGGVVPPLIDLPNIFKAELEGGYYHYEGSLTSPPCTELVKWFVLKTRPMVSQRQMDYFKSIFPDPANNRPIQETHGRAIMETSFIIDNILVDQTSCPDRRLEELTDGISADSGRHLDSAAHLWDYLYPQCWEKWYEMCKGRAQSPVDIDTTGTFPRLFLDVGNMRLANTVHYEPMAGMVRNTGHGIQVTAPFGSIYIEGVQYNVLQFHMHCPSEHTFDGSEFECELHIVHQKEGSHGNNDLLVIGVMYEVGPPSDFLTQLGMPPPPANSQLPPTPESPHFNAGSINLQEEFFSVLNGDFYRYDGSLTTPPCSETVSWFVLHMPKTVSLDQSRQLKAINTMDNNRPLQLLNGRAFLKSTTPGCSAQGCADGGRCPDHQSGADHGDHNHRRLEGFNYLYPQCWAHLPGNEECGKFRQSPIDVNTMELAGNGTSEFPAVWQHTMAEMRVRNNGHTLVANYSGGHMSLPYVHAHAHDHANDEVAHTHLHSHTDRGMQLYRSTQFHIHFPSEHFLDGKQYPAELHFVFQLEEATGTDDLLVVGILFELNNTGSAFLTALGLPNGAPTMVGMAGDRIVTEPIDIGHHFAHTLGGTFYSYAGSLTTPPCTQSVFWNVFETMQPVSQEQIDAFKALFRDPRNNRPLQPLYGRKIYRNDLPEMPPVVAEETSMSRRIASNFALSVVFLSVALCSLL